MSQGKPVKLPRELLDFLAKHPGPFPSGYRVVQYETVISVVIMSFRFPRLAIVTPGDGGVAAGLRSTLTTLLLGWWGIPWGPFWSLRALANNLRGGKDVTASVDAVRAYLAEERRIAEGGAVPPPPGVDAAAFSPERAAHKR